MCSCRNIRSKCCYTHLFANLQGNYSSLSSSDCTQAARNIIKPYSWISWVFASETYGWDSYDDYKMRRSKNVSSTWFWLKESRKKKSTPQLIHLLYPPTILHPSFSSVEIIHLSLDYHSAGVLGSMWREKQNIHFDSNCRMVTARCEARKIKEYNINIDFKL